MIIKRHIKLLAGILIFCTFPLFVVWASDRGGGVSSAKSKSRASGTAQGVIHANKPCQAPGSADGYVLAVSWQNEFCETHRSKPECRETDKTSYQASHFTLHGLWPNKTSCGTQYGFCGMYQEPLRSFCDYPPVPLKSETFKRLGEYMPSARYGSCLERHEWYKHGVCQTTWNADDYFTTAMRLVDDFNANGMSSFMKQNLGRPVTSESFFKAIDKSFGNNAHRKMKILCKNKSLVDIYIRLPLNIPKQARLATLIKNAPDDFDCNCWDSFRVDDMGYNN